MDSVFLTLDTYSKRASQNSQTKITDQRERMIEKTRCGHCGKTYEIAWQDLDEFETDFDDDEFDSFDEESNDDPVFCPFCGLHIDYDE